MQFDTRSLWIYLHFPQLQLDQLNIDKDKPLAIVDTKNNQICQLNAHAQQQGIKLGMGLASASLSCPNLLLHEYNYDIEEHAITHLANALYFVCSDIALAPPQGIALRAQNMLQLYGGLSQYWPLIKQCLAQQQVHYLASSAYSIQAAKVLALCKQSLISEKRERIFKALLKCDIAASDIDPKDKVKLLRIGVKTISDLHQLTSAELANRVSRVSMSLIHELFGKQAAKVKFYHPLSTYSDYLELLYEVHLSARLLPVLNKCISKFSDFLLLRNAHALSINITFFQRDNEALTHTFNSIQGIYKTSQWLDIIELQLSNISFASPVYALRIECTHYETAQSSNVDLFNQKASHVAALTLLSRLQSKLGEQNIHQLRFKADFRPEQSTHKSKFTQGQRACNKSTNYNNSDGLAITSQHQVMPTSIFADRPGLLLEPPEPLTVAVQVIKGPERIQTGWWDNKSVKRDYYIGQSEDGQQVWIFKTPNKQWYLHGYFV